MHLNATTQAHGMQSAKAGLGIATAGPTA
jgi:hypothetical protein